jgi:hypothetical protein
MVPLQLESVLCNTWVLVIKMLVQFKEKFVTFASSDASTIFPVDYYMYFFLCPVPLHWLALIWDQRLAHNYK